MRYSFLLLFVILNSSAYSQYDIGTVITITGNSGKSAMPKYASNGNIYTVGSYNYPTDFDPYGTFILTPSTNYTSTGFIARYSPSGALLSAVKLTAVGGFNIDGFVLDAYDNIYIIGSITGVADFDPGPGNVSLGTTPGTNYGFIAKYNAQGNYVTAKLTTGIISDEQLIINDNEIIFSGRTVPQLNLFQNPGQPVKGGFFARLDFNLNLKSFLNIKDIQNGITSALYIASGKNKSLYCLAAFNGSIQLSPTSDTLTVTQTQALVLAAYDSLNLLLNGGAMPCNSIDMDALGIEYDSSGHVWIAGSFMDTPIDVNINPGSATYLTPDPLEFGRSYVHMQIR